MNIINDDSIHLFKRQVRKVIQWWGSTREPKIFMISVNFHWPSFANVYEWSQEQMKLKPKGKKSFDPSFNDPILILLSFLFLFFFFSFFSFSFLFFFFFFAFMVLGPLGSQALGPGPTGPVVNPALPQTLLETIVILARRKWAP